MTARLDHVVLGATDLRSGRTEMAGSGLLFTLGGQHPAGTHNALLVHPSRWCYAELVSVLESNPSSGGDSLHEQVRRGGLVTYAMAVDDLDSQVERLAAAGFPCRPVQGGSRRTTDGRVVRWRSAALEPGFGRSELPFLIEWAPGEGHRSGLVPDGGAAYVTDIEVGTAHLERMRSLLSVLGFAVRSVGDGLVCSDGEVGMRVLAGEPRLSAVHLTRVDGARVRITDRPEARRFQVRIDTTESVE